MALFNPSTQSVSGVCGIIADTVGASGDSDMTTRAGRSLNAAIKHFNSRCKWDWLRTEASPVSILAPFGVTATVSAGQASATAGAGHGIKVDDFLTGANFFPGTRVTATAAGSYGFNQAVTATAAGANAVSATATRDMYDLPTDWKTPYSFKMLSGKYALYPMVRRIYDRSQPDEFVTTTPIYYDVFQTGTKGKIRLLNPPAGSDILLMRYHRRMATATATADATVIDIPQDYDEYLISWAKWHFLVDKAEGRAEQATTWLSLANEGLKTMLADQTDQPDQDLMITPGAYSYSVNVGPNSTRWVEWDYQT